VKETHSASVELLILINLTVNWKKVTCDLLFICYWYLRKSFRRQYGKNFTLRNFNLMQEIGKLRRENFGK